MKWQLLTKNLTFTNDLIARLNLVDRHHLNISTRGTEMIQILGRNWHRLAWFMAGLLSTVLFSFGFSNLAQSVTVASPSNSVYNSASQLKSWQPQPSNLSSSFEEVAASHLEPNFYD